MMSGDLMKGRNGSWTVGCSPGSQQPSMKTYVARTPLVLALVLVLSAGR